MAYLLDTHTFLWALTDPSKLGRTAKQVIEDSENMLFVSSVSAWEISIKYRRGKLPEAEAVIAGYHDHLKRLGGNSLAITEDHAILAGHLGWTHRDPFDRMLAAQSMIESLTLVTNDRIFGMNGVRSIW